MRGLRKPRGDREKRGERRGCRGHRERVSATLPRLDLREFHAVLHFLDCQDCSSWLLGRFGFGPKLADAVDEAKALPTESIWTRIDRRLAVAWDNRQRERALAGLHLGVLLEGTEQARHAQLQATPELHSLATVELLLESCSKADLEERGQRALLALAVFEHLSGSQRIPALEASLTAATLVQLAEVRRLEGRLDAAEEALGAIPAQLADCHDLFERARLCRELGLLRRDQGRFEEALALLARACRLFARIEDRRREAEVQLERAELELEVFEPAEALEGYLAVARSAPLDLAPHLRARAVRGAAWCLVVLEGSDRAWSFVSEIRTRWRWSPRSWEGLALRRVEGELLLARDDMAAASDALVESLDGFLELGDALEAAASATWWLHLNAKSPVELGQQAEIAARISAIRSLSELSPKLSRGLDRARRDLVAGRKGMRNLIALTELVEQALRRLGTKSESLEVSIH